MSDIRLFRTDGTTVTALNGQSVALEKSLQELIERHLDVFLGVRFLESEYSTGKTHAGRIDTLGLDEDYCPVIIEYKRSANENVINQGLFYLDWLLDHKAEFELLVLRKFGEETSDEIEWSNPRLLCIAGDFTKYDVHAVQQINRNIELLRYARFGNDLLLLELVNAVQASTIESEQASVEAKQLLGRKQKKYDKTFVEQQSAASQSLLDAYAHLKATVLSLGSDVQEKELELYIAFKRIKNFACVVMQANQDRLLVFVKVDPDTVQLEEGSTRDVREIGHWGTGDLEVTIRTRDDVQKAFPLLLKSYEAS